MKKKEAAAKKEKYHQDVAASREKAREWKQAQKARQSANKNNDLLKIKMESESKKRSGRPRKIIEDKAAQKLKEVQHQLEVEQKDCREAKGLLHEARHKFNISRLYPNQELEEVKKQLQEKEAQLQQQIQDEVMFRKQCIETIAKLDSQVDGMKKQEAANEATKEV